MKVNMADSSLITMILHDSTLSYSPEIDIKCQKVIVTVRHPWIHIGRKEYYINAPIIDERNVREIGNACRDEFLILQSHTGAPYNYNSPPWAVLLTRIIIYILYTSSYPDKHTYPYPCLPKCKLDLSISISWGRLWAELRNSWQNRV